MTNIYIRIRSKNFLLKSLYLMNILLLISCTSQINVDNSSNNCTPEKDIKPQSAIFYSSGIVEFSHGFQNVFFDTENNLWTCQNSSKSPINILNNGDATATFLSAFSIYEGRLNFITVVYSLNETESILEFSNAICSSMGFSYMFQPSGKKLIFGCQITPLSHSAVMLRYSDNDNSVEIGSLSIYDPIIKKALAEYSQKKRASN